MTIPKFIQPFAKIVAIALVVSLNGVGLMAVGDTVGFYMDIEQSSANAFVAGHVDFTATSTAWNPAEVAISMAPGDTTTTSFSLDPLSSNPFQHFIQATTTGDSAFCTGIGATLTENTNTLYSGSLASLVTGTTTATSTFTLSASTGVNNFQNSVCTLSLDFVGWQTRHNFPTVGGFNDTETVSKKLASWGFRINKVYADVDPNRYVEGTSTEPPNEWVEIYNQTDVGLDISGWEICDNYECDTIPSGTPLIPGMGYAVIVNNPGVFSATGTAPWYLPAGVVEISLGEAIGNGLSNSADMLVLKRPDGVVVDQMNWGTPSVDWTNYAAYGGGVWTPGVPAAAEGNLLARVPSGYDTNQPSDWKELKPPSVDLIYPDEVGSYTWYWGYSYTITWSALNHNGPNGDLNISLFYIKDVDGSETITPLDTTHTIISTTENDGAYTWKVPSGFIGYIWIKLVATGPENPLNNSRTISTKIYDPFPLFVGPEGVEPENMGDVDMEAPVITVQGNNPALVPQGAVYVDLGASVSDNINQNLGVTVLGDVDTSVIGEYVITYTAIDQAGNVGTAERVVIVYDPVVGSPILPVPEVTESSVDVAPETGSASSGALPEESTTESVVESVAEEDVSLPEEETEVPIVITEEGAMEEESSVVEDGTHHEEASQDSDHGNLMEESVSDVAPVENEESSPSPIAEHTEEDFSLFREEDGETGGDVVEGEQVVEEELPQQEVTL